ncbi:hypothetical protein CXR29_03890 [Brevibacterium linens]|nr:hypothetical protein CXR29_03890 [Brevibacterium linens]
MFVGGFFFVASRPSEQIATFVILLASAIVMIWRAIYAWKSGLWGRHISWSVEALKPERTAIVTMGIMVVIAAVGVIGDLNPPAGDKSVDVLVALFLTGGLFAALITSPHSLIELAESDQREEWC